MKKRDLPEKVVVRYEAEGISDKVDSTLIAALGYLGYECGDTGAFLDKGSPTIERDMEFMFTGNKGDLRYLTLWKEEIESLLDMTKISIEAVGEMDDSDDILAWFYGISARLKEALE
jgi:hypothetical protein